MKVDLAENWWLEKGQYCNPDSYLHPRDVIKEAFNSGFNLGLTLGQSQANKPVEPKASKSFCSCWPQVKNLRCPIHGDSTSEPKGKL